MYLLRHAQSYFNLHFSATQVDPGIVDPELTPLGLEQAASAARSLSSTALSRIIISPYTRALQTAAPIVQEHAASVDILHEVRERAAFVCDIGSSPEVLATRFPLFEFGHLPTRWWPDGEESEEETVARANDFRATMATRRDQASTLLVSHWAFLLALTGKSLENGEVFEYDPASAAPRELGWK